HPGMRAVNRALDASGQPTACSDDELRAAATAIARLPLWDVVGTGLLSVAVVVGVELLERIVAGPHSPNFGVIARSGVVACGLYMGAGLMPAELVVRPGCRTLRRQAAHRGIALEEPFFIGRAHRVVAAVVPPVAALVVAVEIGASAHATGTAYALLIGLSVVVT